MLFKNKECKKCKHVYDEALEYCPNCGSIDNDYRKFGVPKNVFMTPVLNQVFFVVIGFIILLLLTYLFAQIFVSVIDSSQESTILMLSNSIPYAIVFLGLLACLINVRKPLFCKLKQWKSYLWGLLFGAVLIGFSYLYSYILDITGFTVNTNQSVADLLILSFPIGSLIIMGFVAPICEEITYRLGLFSFACRINKYVAYAVVIIFFGLIHFDFSSENIITELVSLPQYMLAGLLLCIAYEWKGLPCCITAHVLNNVFAVVFTLIFGVKNA